MMMLMERIVHAWKEGACYSVIFMNVTGAFNYVHYKRIIYNMQKKKVHGFIVKWVENFLQNRSTKLQINRVELERICMNVGDPQFLQCCICFIIQICWKYQKINLEY